MKCEMRSEEKKQNKTHLPLYTIDMLGFPLQYAMMVIQEQNKTMAY